MTLDHLTYSTEHAAREWHRAFEWHLDVVPPLIEMIIWTSMPSIRASRFDQIKITGGGFIDNIPDEIPGEQALQDARELWSWLTSYTGAVAEWITPERPAPVLADKPDADPLTARSLALTTIGWLIDHDHQVHDVAELDEHTDAMFVIIRSLRGRYGVFPKPRRQLELCTTCGERQVAFAWVSNPNGSPKPIRVGKCRRCGESYEVKEAAAPTPAPIVLSEACADLEHVECESLHCECHCHQRGAA